MASISTQKNGLRSLQFIGLNGGRHTIRLGRCNKKVADTVKLRVENLIDFVRTGTPFDVETRNWLETISEELAEKLRKFKLMPGTDGKIRDVQWTIAEEQIVRPEPKRHSWAEERAKIGKVYFIRSGEFVKIGFTYDAVGRIVALQTGSPLNLELLYSFKGSPSEEKLVHEKFAAYRVRKQNEWFHLVEEILVFIEECKRNELLKPVAWTDKKAADNIGLTAGLLY